MALWSQLRSPKLAVLLVATALCLVRARDQPGLDVGLGGTTATIVPGDIALLVLLAVALASLPRRPWPWLVLGAAGVLCALVVVTGATNGTPALVASVKLAELAVLGLAAFALIRTYAGLESLVDVLLVFTLVADVVAGVEIVSNGGGRQASFLGEHDFAALATLPLLYGLVLVFEERRGARAALALVAGAVGCIFGAALASLVGLYLGAAAVVVVAAMRSRLRMRPVAVTALVVAVVTAGTLMLRSGELGFVQSWFGKPAERPGQYAASWSQRLIYAYVGGRVFLDHPLAGTGWYPRLPPSEYVRYLPDARRRFSDQPERYFPPTDGLFIPQQGYDQVLYELGIVGAAALLAMLFGAGRAAARTARVAAPLAALPAVWLAAAIGAVAGEGLFGGTPLAALFWLVTGVVIAFPLGVRA
jgi:hypothetical protein